MGKIVEVADLTPEAQTALINFGSSNPGTRLPQGTAGRVVAELKDRGLITVYKNLTRHGGIVRDRALAAALDAL
jgi:hypothetical protein